MSFDYSNYDRSRLEQVQIERFRSLFPPLMSAFFEVDLEETLHIQLSADLPIAALDRAQVATQAWLTFGVSRVRLWQDTHCAWDLEGFWGGASDEPGNVLESLTAMSHDEGSPMTTATLERPISAATAMPQTTMPGCTVAAIAADVEASPDAVREWLTANSAIIIPFGGEEVVTGEAAILAFNYFTPLLVQRRLQQRGLSLEAPIPAAANGAAPQPEAKPQAKPLRLPNAYSKLLLKSPRSTLEKLLPQDAAQRTSYLEAVVTETEPGKNWLNRVASAYTTKFKGELDKNRQSLLTAAQKLFAEARSSAGVN